MQTSNDRTEQKTPKANNILKSRNRPIKQKSDLSVKRSSFITAKKLSDYINTDLSFLRKNKEAIKEYELFISTDKITYIIKYSDFSAGLIQNYDKPNQSEYLIISPKANHLETGILLDFKLKGFNEFFNKYKISEKRNDKKIPIIQDSTIIGYLINISKTKLDEIGDLFSQKIQSTYKE